MIKRLKYAVGDQPDVVGDFFENVYTNYKGSPMCTVHEFENSETRISLLKIDDKTQAFVIESRTEFNNLEFILGNF